MTWPVSCYHGPLVPSEEWIWQDPIPAPKYVPTKSEIASLKEKILASGLNVSELVATAWDSARTHRGSDLRGGANGARIRLAPPKKDWMGDEPERLRKMLSVLEGIQKAFADDNGGKEFSMADLIVLAGTAAAEKAIKDAGFNVPLQFNAGRGDAVQEMTDAKSF